MLTHWYSTPRLPLWSSPRFGSSLFDGVVQNMFEAPRSVSSGPRFATYRNDDETMVVVEVPGLTADDVQISVENGRITVSGERGVNVPEGYEILKSERAAMRFARSFTVADDMDADNIAAKLDNGMLTLRIPKRPEAQPRTIPIKVS